MTLNDLARICYDEDDNESLLITASVVVRDRRSGLIRVITANPDGTFEVKLETGEPMP